MFKTHKQVKMLVVVFAVVLLTTVEASGVTRVKRLALGISTNVCYGSLGCFSTDPPFSWSPGRPLAFLPLSPDIIRTKLLLYTRDSRNKPQVLDPRHCTNPTFLPANFAVRPTKFLVHGFVEIPAILSHWQNMLTELLKHGDYNVIMVDWSKGNLPPYTQATANTRVVGAQIAECIHAIINATTLTVADFHLIGFSLGAHICGYAGERIPGLGRITGLDAGGPYFEGTHPRVRLDETDAQFVDVIHTDASPLLPTLGLGTRTQSGHADYYPNLGRDQPGCDRFPVVHLLENNLIDGVGLLLACDHFRSVYLFVESINSVCPFLAFPCASEDDFVNKRCGRSCANGGCARMGFRADENKPAPGQRVKYYLTTGSTPPYCRYRLTVTVRFSPGRWQEERGTLAMAVSGSSTLSEKISLTQGPLVFSPGRKYTFYAMIQHNVQNIQSVTVLWEKASFILDLFGFKKPIIFLDGIDIYLVESNTEVRVCAMGQNFQAAKPLVLSKC